MHRRKLCVICWTDKGRRPWSLPFAKMLLITLLELSGLSVDWVISRFSSFFLSFLQVGMHLHFQYKFLHLSHLCYWCSLHLSIGSVASKEMVRSCTKSSTCHSRLSYLPWSMGSKFLLSSSSPLYCTYPFCYFLILPTIFYT